MAYVEKTMLLALEEFVMTIEDTGGVIKDHETGMHVPVADLDWIDLGEAYIRACAALNRPPKVS